MKTAVKLENKSKSDKSLRSSFRVKLKKQSDGEIDTESTHQHVFTSSSKSLGIEQTDPDEFQLEPFSADDDDLG